MADSTIGNLASGAPIADADQFALQRSTTATLKCTGADINTLILTHLIPYEAVSGMNGSATTFTVSNTVAPSSGYLNLWFNGVYQRPNGIDFTVTGNHVVTITFTAGAADTIYAQYWK